MRTGFCEKTIDGVSIGFKFGTNAFQLLTDMHNKEFHEIDAIMSNAGGIRDLIFCAYRANALSTGKEMKLNVYQIGDWLDDLPQSDYDDILKALESAKVLGEGLNVSKEDEPKK